MRENRDITLNFGTFSFPLPATKCEAIIYGKDKVSKLAGPGSRLKRSEFEPQPGSLCCVLRRDTVFSQFISLPRVPGNIMIPSTAACWNWDIST